MKTSVTSVVHDQADMMITKGITITWIRGTDRGWHGVYGERYASRGKAPGLKRARCCPRDRSRSCASRTTDGHSHGQPRREPRTWCPEQTSTGAITTCTQSDNCRTCSLKTSCSAIQCECGIDGPIVTRPETAQSCVDPGVTGRKRTAVEGVDAPAVYSECTSSKPQHDSHILDQI